MWQWGWVEVLSSCSPHHVLMGDHAAFTTIDEAITHPLTLALLGLEAAGRLQGVAPRYIGLREVPGARPPDAVLGVCAVGDAACPGHSLPSRSAQLAFACCRECRALVGGTGVGRSSDARRAAGAGRGKPAAAGWVCQEGYRAPAQEAPPPAAARAVAAPPPAAARAVAAPPAAPAPPRAQAPPPPAHPRFGVFTDPNIATTNINVRHALGMEGSKRLRARWIGLRLEAQPDGTHRLVGVCHAHHTGRGCPGHPLLLDCVTDATACCGGYGRAVTSHSGVQRARDWGRGRAPGAPCWTVMVR